MHKYSKTKKKKEKVKIMAITSESQIIDVVTIDSGCKIIEEAARDYTTCANKIKEAASICTDQALSVEKKSMQPSIQDLGDSVATIQGNIEYFTSQIRAVATTIYSQQMTELNNYREQKAKEEQARLEAERQAAQNTQTTN